MTSSNVRIPVYLETGKQRVFACAVEWPGWCRSGKTAEAALQALLEAGPRYAKVLRGTRLGFKAPKDVAAFEVVEKVKGNATTDFGAPGVLPKVDRRPLEAAELRRLESILKASWKAFDAAAEAAGSRPLRKGPRGGGRDLERIIRHVLGADAGYLSALGWKFKADEKAAVDAETRRTRAAMLEGLAASARGEIPTKGPRGGERWTARYFARRAAWHALDHAWEIEDRSGAGGEG